MAGEGNANICTFRQPLRVTLAALEPRPEKLLGESTLYEIRLKPLTPNMDSTDTLPRYQYYPEGLHYSHGLLEAVLLVNDFLCFD